MGPALLLTGVAACGALSGADDLEVGLPSTDGGGTSSSGTSGGTSGGSVIGDHDGATTDANVGQPSSSPCAVAHTFCDDFDGPSLEQKWAFVRTTGGTVAHDTSMSVSAPRSLRVSVRPGSGTREALVHNDATFGNGEKVAELGYDLLVDRGSGSFDEVDYGVLMPFPPPPDAEAHGIALVDRPSGMKLQYFRETESGQYLTEEAPVQLPEGWVHVVLRVDYTESPPRGSVTFNGGESTTVSMTPSTATSMSYEVGANYMESVNTNVVIHVDNVTFDTR